MNQVLEASHNWHGLFSILFFILLFSTPHTIVTEYAARLTIGLGQHGTLASSYIIR